MTRAIFKSDLERQFQKLPRSLEELAQEAIKSLRHDFDSEFKNRFFETVGYVPHDGQRQIHDCDSRFIAVTAGRRFGKSSACAAEAAAMITMPKKTVWIVAPTYELGTRVFVDTYNMIVHSLGMKEAKGSSFSRGILRLENQSIVSVRTLENVQSLVGAAVNLLIIDEVQYCPKGAWQEQLLPAVSGRGIDGRVLMIGTPAPGHWVSDIIADVEARAGTPDEDKYWAAFQAPSYANPHLYPGGAEDPEIQMLRKTMLPDDFAEQILGRPRRPRLQVYREWAEDVHVRPDAAFDPSLDVYLSFDPGTANGYGVLAFQWHADTKQLMVIDEFEEAGHTGHDVWQELRTRPWWANVRLAVCDDAAPSEILFWCRARESGGPGIPTIPAFKQKGEPQASVAAGIRLVKRYLRDPEKYAQYADTRREEIAHERWGVSYANLDPTDQHECDNAVDDRASIEQKREWSSILVSPQCVKLREEMKAYQYYQGRISGRNLREMPDKKNDHLVDSFRYYLFGLDPAGKKWGSRRSPEHRTTGASSLRRSSQHSQRPDRVITGSRAYAA